MTENDEDRERKLRKDNRQKTLEEFGLEVPMVRSNKIRDRKIRKDDEQETLDNFGKDDDD